MIKYICYCDGGCNGNGTNGASAIGSYAIYRWYTEDPKVHPHHVTLNENDKPLVHESRIPLAIEGRHTNNIAEIKALQLLLMRLDHMHILQEQVVEIYSDSELIINQFYGVFGIKNQYLQKIHMEIKDFLATHKPFNLELLWISGDKMKRTIIGH